MVGILYRDFPGKRDGGFTIFYMGINLGAAIAPLLCGIIGETYGWGWGFGLATIGFGVSRWFWFSLLMLFGCGAMDNVSVIVRHTLVQLLTPDEKRGRVSAVNSLFIGTSNELGGFESGFVAYLLGQLFGRKSGSTGGWMPDRQLSLTAPASRRRLPAERRAACASPPALVPGPLPFSSARPGTDRASS